MGKINGKKVARKTNELELPETPEYLASVHEV